MLTNVISMNKHFTGKPASARIFQQALVPGYDVPLAAKGKLV
jgi:hypothetical protein